MLREYLTLQLNDNNFQVIKKSRKLDNQLIASNEQTKLLKLSLFNKFIREEKRSKNF